MYQLLPIKEPTIINKNPIQSVMNLETGWCIPFDPANTDAKEFAKWLSEGGVPEPAVEGETVSAEWIAETIAKLSPAENT